MIAIIIITQGMLPPQDSSIQFVGAFEHSCSVTSEQQSPHHLFNTESLYKLPHGMMNTLVVGLHASIGCHLRQQRLPNRATNGTCRKTCCNKDGLE